MKYSESERLTTTYLASIIVAIGIGLLVGIGIARTAMMRAPEPAPVSP